MNLKKIFTEKVNNYKFIKASLAVLCVSLVILLSFSSRIFSIFADTPDPVGLLYTDSDTNTVYYQNVYIENGTTKTDVGVIDITLTSTGTANAYLYGDGMVVLDGEGTLSPSPFYGKKGGITKAATSVNGFRPNTCEQLFSNFSKLQKADLSTLYPATSMYSMFTYCEKLTSLEFGDNIDTSSVTDMSYMFHKCSSLTSLDLSSFDTSNVTNMNRMFKDCGNLTSLDLSDFETSNVEDMGNMFEYCSSLTSLDISNFDTSNVKNMCAMFEYCSSLTSLDISNFNTSSVTNMGNMFQGCNALTSITFRDNFDTSNVTNMSSMFYDCSSLTNLDISSFDTSSVTAMNHMFYDCSSLTSLDISNFDTSNVTNMSYMFDGCSKLKNIVINKNKFKTDNVENMDHMFNNCKLLKTFDDNKSKMDFSGFNTSNVKNMSYMFYECDKIITLDLSSFNLYSNINMQNMFSNMDNLKKLDIHNFDFSSITKPIQLFDFTNCTNIEEIVLPCGISSININLPQDNVTGKEWKGYDINNTPISDVTYDTLPSSDDTDGDGTFESGELYKLRVVYDYLYLDSDTGTKYYADKYIEGGVTKDAPKKIHIGDSASDLVYAYVYNDGMLILDGEGNCDYLDSTFIYNNPANVNGVVITKAAASTNGFKTNRLDDVFKNLTSLTRVDFSNFDTSNVTNMSWMFYKCNSLVEADLSNFDTSKVTDMNRMFQECSSLKRIDFSNFDTSNVTNMSYMFYKCSSLVEADLSDFDTSNVTNMSSMFQNCSSLTSLDVSSFDTSNVSGTSNTAGMYSMFSGCSNLQTLTLDPDKFDTSKVYSMQSMFNNCNKLTSIDVSKFNTSNCHYMNSMFDYCKALTSITFGDDFDTSKVEDMNNMFDYCISLTSLDISNFDTSNVTNMKKMFAECNALTSITFGDDFDTSKVIDMNSMFQNCSSLTTLDISSFNTSSVSGTSNYEGMYYMFGSCSNLQTLTLDPDKFNTSNVYSMYSMFRNCKKLTSIDVSKFDTSNCCYMTCMFDGCESLTNLDLSSFNTSKVIDMNNMFYGCKTLELLDIKTFDTSNVTNMSRFFDSCTNLKNIVITTSKFKTSNVTDMSNMFNNCILLETFDANKTKMDFSGFDTSNVTNMSSMFYDCDNIITLDLSSFRLSSGTNTSFMFSFMDNIKKLDIRNFDLSNIASGNLFTINNLRTLEEIVLPSAINATAINLPSVSGKEWKGYDINNKLIPGTTFDTLQSSVDTDGDDTFETGELFKIKLKGPAQLLYDDTTNNKKYYEDGFKVNGGALVTDSLLSTFDLSQEQDESMMAYLYSDGTLLFDGEGHYDGSGNYIANYIGDGISGYLDIANYSSYNSQKQYSSYASNITRVRFSDKGYKPNNMAYAFFGLINLTDIDFTNLDTSELVYAECMFSFCTSLESLDLSSLDFSKLETIEGMFYNCLNLESISMGQMTDNDTNGVIYIGKAFAGCNKLSSLDLSGMIFDIDKENGIGEHYPVNPFIDEDLYKYGESYFESQLAVYLNRVFNSTDETSDEADIIRNIRNKHFDDLEEIKLPLIREDSDLILLPEIIYTDSEGNEWSPSFINSIDYYMYADVYDDTVMPTTEINYKNYYNLSSSYMYADSDKKVIPHSAFMYNIDENTNVRSNSYIDYRIASSCLVSKSSDITYMIRDCVIYSDPKQGGKNYYFNGTNGEEVITSIYTRLGSVYFILYKDGTLVLYGDAHIDDRDESEYVSDLLCMRDNLDFLQYLYSTLDLDLDKDNKDEYGRINNILQIACSDDFNTSLGQYSFGGTVVDEGATYVLPKLTRVDFSKGNLTYWNVLTYGFTGDVNLETVDLSGVDFSNITDQNNAMGLFSMMCGATARDFMDLLLCMYPGSTESNFLEASMLGNNLTFEEFEENYESMKSDPGFAAQLSMYITEMPNFKEIVLPKEVPSGDIEIKLPIVPGKVFYGADRDGNIDYSKTYTKLVKQTDDVYKLVTGEASLFYDEDTSTIYYTTGTNKTEGDDAITLVKSWDLTDTTSTPAGSLMAYLYSDGMMIFDGEGNNIRYTSYEPWYNDDVPGISPSIKCNKFITKVAFSNNGFKPTSLNYMFNSLYNCTEFLNMDKLDTSQCKTFVRAFAFYTVADINDNVYKTLDLSHFDFSGITEPTDAFSYMFNNSRKLENIVWPNTMNTSNVTKLDYMFAGCRALSSNSINDFIDKLDTTNIVSLAWAFDATQVDDKFNTLLGKIDLAKVSWQGLCAGIYKATYIDLSNSNFTNTTGCIHPTNLNGFMWETYGVQNVILNNDMTIYDFSHVTDYSTCFNNYDKAGHGGSAYNDVDEENVIHKLCYELFDFTSTTTMSQMFRKALSLTKIDFTKFRNLDTTGTTLINTSGLFQEDFDLQEVKFPENFTIDSIGQWTFYNLNHIENINWEDVIVVNPLNVNTEYVLSNMGSNTEVSKLAPKYDFSNFKFTGDNPSGAFANNMSAKEIVMPQDTASRIPFISALVKGYNKYDYFALDSDGNTLYKIKAATNSTVLATRYNPTDAQKEATVRLVQGNLLYRDDYNNTPSNKNDDRLYYDCGTSDDSITLVNSWDITKVGTAPNGSPAGSLMAYLYSDGTFIYDGQGVNKSYTYNEPSSSQEITPWKDKIDDITRIVISDNGFKPTNLDSLFAYYKGTKFYNFNKLDTSSCKSMDNAFKSSSNLTELDVSNFNTLNVTSMRNTFNIGSSQLTQITGLDKLDTRNVKDMTYIFNQASSNSSFTLDLSKLNTSNVTNFYGAFANLNLSSIDLSNLDTTNAISMDSMFYGMRNITEIDISTFDTSKVTNMRSMFQGCYNLETIKIKFDDTALTSEYYTNNMFASCPKLKTIDLTGSTITKNLLPLSTVNSLEKVVLPTTISSNISLYTKDGHYKWVEANSSFIPLTPEVTHDKLIAMSSETNGAKTLVRIDDLLYDDGSTKYYRDGTDKEDESLGDNRITLVTYDHDNDDSTAEIPRIYDLSTAGNGSVNAYLYTDGTFIYDGKGTNIGYDEVDNKRPWFTDGNINLITRIVISNNGFKPTNLNRLFSDYIGTQIYQLDKLDTSNCTNMTYAFRDSKNLTSLDLSKFDTSNVQIMDGIFMGCEGLTSLNLSSFDTSKVINMGSMFWGCKGLSTLNLSNFVTTSATTMYGMFNACSNLTSVNISSFNTSNVKSMAYMFSGCNSLTSLSVSHFDTSKVETMSTMFSDCSSLTSLNVSNFNTSACTNMYAMFNGCKKITSLNLSNFDTSKVKDTNIMFNNMNELATLELKFNDAALNDATSMFSGCSKLTTLDLTGSTITNNVFSLSTGSALTKIILPDSVASDTANDSSNPSLPTKTWVKFKSNGDAYNSTLYTTLPAKTASGDYLGTAIPLSQCTFSACEVEYDGTAKQPNFAGLITFNTTTLVPGTDYTVSDYANNVEAGTATCTITGKGAYTGKIENVSFTIKPKAISVNLGAPNYEAKLKQQKDYDGTTNAESKSLTINGVTYQEEGSDTPVTEIINISLAASYDSSDAGDRNMIYHPEVTSITGGHANVSNYLVSFDNRDGSNNVTLNNYGKINGIEIHYTLSNFTKVYDGNSDITLTITLDDPSGILEGQTIGNEGTDVIIPSTVHGTFNDKNVGEDKSITVDTITLTGDKSGNYYLVPKENVKGSITKKLLTYTLGTLDKTFDGTNTNNSVTVTNLTGVESIDEGKVTISSPITATFISSNVGTYYSEDHASYVADPSNKVSLSEITLSGTESGDESGNYKIEQPTSYSGTISALGLTSDMFKAISDMTYTGSEIKPSLEVSEDYISKLNLANDIEVTYTDNIDKGEATVTIKATDTGNFNGSSDVTLHFEILAKDIEVNLADEKYSTLLHQEKTYDGTNAGKDDLSIQADGVTGETLVITLTSTYEDKNVGTKDMKYVPSFSSVTGGRCKTTNYNVTYTNINDGVVTLDDYGTITEKLLTYTLGSLDKEYDGTNTNSNVEVTNLTGVETIDEGKVTISSPITATFSSSNVGTYQSSDTTNNVSLSEITLSGTESGNESGNYKIEQPTSYSGKIKSMMLSESMFESISNETYNGLAHEPSLVIASSYTDKLVLDRDVIISYSNNINASVGTSDATVTIKAKDTGNFSGSSDVTLHFTIDPCEVEIDLGENSYKEKLEQTKEYDGTTVAKYDMSVITNGCNGDKLITTFTNATYDSKNAGTRKIIYTPTFSSVQGDRPYTSNYIVTYKNAESGNVTLDDYGKITTKEISYTTQTTKVYDGTNVSSTVITLNDSDIISSDLGKVTVVSPVAGTYDDELVDDNKVVTPTNSVLTLEGEECGNYKVNDLSNLTGSITLPSSDKLIVDAIGNVTYNGSALTPALTIKYDVDGDGTGDITLVSGTDFDAVYTNNINAGINTASVAITYKGNYTGTDSKTFTILPRPVTINLNSFVESYNLTQEKIYDATVNPDADDNAKFINYADPGVSTGEVLRFDLAGVYDSKNVGTRDIIYTVTFTSVTSPNGLTSNYDITYSNGVTTDGITKVTLADAGKITQKDITRSDYDLTIKTKAYDGNAITSIDNFSLHEGVIFSGDNVVIDDYSSCVVTLSDSKEGTHSISSISPPPTISGTDSANYNLVFTYDDVTGTIAKDVLQKEMFMPINDVLYTGNYFNLTPQVTSSYINKITPYDYVVTYENNIDVSTEGNKAKVIITAKDGGNYSGSVTLEFTIKKKDITVDLNDTSTYTGSVTQEKVYNAKLNADSKVIETSMQIYRPNGYIYEVINIPLKGSYTTKVAGETKEINYVVDESIGMTVTGGQGKISNYNVIINNLTGNYGKITKKPVTYTLVINDKVFDGNNKTTIKLLTINDGVIESNESSVLDDLGFGDYSSTVVTLASSANGTHLVTDINPVPELLGNDKDNYSLDFKWDGITGTINNKVIPEDGSGLTISNTLTDNKVMYTGKEIPIESLGITIKDTVTGNTLVLGTDYTLSYTSSDGLSTTDATNAGENKKVYINGIGDYAGETYTTFTIVPKTITYSDLIMSDKLKTDNTKDLTKYINGKQNRFIHYETDELEIYYLHDISGTTTDTSDDYRINFNYSDAFISDSSKAIIPFGDLESSKSLKNIVVDNLSPALAESNYKFVVDTVNEYMFTNKGYLVDNTKPTIVSLVTDNTMYGKDQTITFTMTLSEEIKPISDTSDVYLKLDIDDVYNEDNDPSNNKVATLMNVSYDAENSSANTLSGDNITKTVLTFKYTIDITDQIHTYHIDPKLEIVNEQVTDISGNELDTSIPSSYDNEIEIDTNGFSVDITHDKTLIDNIFTKDDEIIYTIKINTPNNIVTSDSDVKDAIKILIGDSNYENYVDKSSDYTIEKINNKEYKVVINTSDIIGENDTLGKSIKVSVDKETITDNLGNTNSAKDNVLKVLRTLDSTLEITYDGNVLTRTSDGKMIDSNGSEVLIFNNDKVTITSMVTNAIIKYKDMLNASNYISSLTNTFDFIVKNDNYEITSIYEFLTGWAKSPEEGNLKFRIKTLSDLVEETNKDIDSNKLNDLSNALLNEKNILLLDESDSSNDLTLEEKAMLSDSNHTKDIAKELARRVNDNDLISGDEIINETNIENEVKDIIKGLKDRDEFLDEIDPLVIGDLTKEDIESLMIDYTFKDGWVRTILDTYPKVIELKEAYNNLLGDNETISLVSQDDEVTVYGVVNRSDKDEETDLLKLIVRPIVDNPEFNEIKDDLESYLVNPNEKVLQPYDIKLVNITKGNSLVQPKEGTKMLVTIELPKEYTNRIIHVYHEHDPISDSDIKVTKYKDKCYVEFYTDSFSNFTLTTDDNINSVIISKENEIGGNINPDSKVIINDLVTKGINELQFTISLNKDYKAEIYKDGTKVKELTSSGIYTLDKLDEINTNVFIKAKFIKVEPKKDDEDPKKDITSMTITVQVANHIPYINGYGDNTFRPNKNMTRAEFSKVISSISNNFNTYTFDKSNVSKYKDVKDTAWYSKYVGYMTKTHLMSGYPDGTFKPNDPITRAEVCKVLSSMFNMPVKDIENIFYNELDGHWYFNSTNKMIKAGYINGYPDGTFKPNKDVTRAEAVSLINRVKDRAVNKDKNISSTYKNTLNNKYKDVKESNWFYNDLLEASVAHSSFDLH